MLVLARAVADTPFGDINIVVLTVAVAAASSMGYAAGALLQRRVATTSQDVTGDTVVSPKPFTIPLWWIAVALTSVGTALHVLALRIGPLSLVQPLGALSLVFAVPLGALVTASRPAAREWWGAGLTVCALVGLVGLTTPTAPAPALTMAEGFAVLAVVGVALAALMWGAQRANAPTLRSLLLAAAAGIAFGTGSSLTRVVVTGFSDADAVVLVMPWAIAVAALAVAGLLLSQAAYRAGLGAQLATLTMVNPVVAALIGVATLDERFASGVALQLLPAVVLLGGIGVVLLAGERHDESDAVRTAPVTTTQRQPTSRQTPADTSH